jgi:hypothetical protein
VILGYGFSPPLIVANWWTIWSKNKSWNPIIFPPSSELQLQQQHYLTLQLNYDLLLESSKGESKGTFTLSVRDFSVESHKHHVSHYGLKPTYHENFIYKLTFA